MSVSGVCRRSYPGTVAPQPILSSSCLVSYRLVSRHVPFPKAPSIPSVLCTRLRDHNDQCARPVTTTTPKLCHAPTKSATTLLSSSSRPGSSMNRTVPSRPRSPTRRRTPTIPPLAFGTSLEAAAAAAAASRSEPAVPDAAAPSRDPEPPPEGLGVTTLPGPSSGLVLSLPLSTRPFLPCC